MTSQRSLSCIRWRARGRALVPVAALVGLLASTAVSAQPATSIHNASAAVFDFPRDRDHLLLEYGLHHDELAENDPTPLVRIYGDGTVLVHRPAYMRRAGSFRTQLGDAALTELVRSLAKPGLVELDGAQLDAMVRQADAARQAKDGTFVHISDHSWTRISLHLGQWDPRGTGLDAGPKSHTIRFADVRWQAERFPELAPLQALAAAQRSLHALWSSDALVEDGANGGSN